MGMQANGHRPYIVHFPRCPMCSATTSAMPGESPFQPKYAPPPKVSASNEPGQGPLMPDPRIWIRCDSDKCEWTGSAKVTYTDTDTETAIPHA